VRFTLSRELKKSDPVRVTNRNHLKDDHPGEVSGVLTGPEFLPKDGRCCYPD
jgi:hypothetical protein